MNQVLARTDTASRTDAISQAEQYLNDLVALPPGIEQHVGVQDGPWETEVSPTHRTTRRAARRSFDEFLVDMADGDGVLEVGGSRLSWWRQRRRLQRRYGIVAERMGKSTWELRRKRA